MVSILPKELMLSEIIEIIEFRKEYSFLISTYKLIQQIYIYFHYFFLNCTTQY